VDWQLLFVTWGMDVFLLTLSAIVGWKMPRLTRPSIFFSVTVRPDFRDTPEAAAIVRQYQRSFLAHTAIAYALAAGMGVGLLVLGATGAGVIVGVVALQIVPLLWQIIGLVTAFLRGRRETMPHAVSPSMIREASLAPRPQGQLYSRLTKVLLVAPILVVAATALYLWARRDAIPQRYPIHWGLNGQVDDWGTRSVGDVFGPLLMSLGAYAIFLAIWGGLKAGTRRVRASGPSGAKETTFRAVFPLMLLVMGNALVVVLSVTAAWIPFYGSTAFPAAPMAFVFVALFAATGVCMALIIRMGQGGQRLKDTTGSRAASQPSTHDEIIGDGTLDRHWRGGMFYCNPDDPSVLVEYRFGVGWTLNFARPLAWLIIVLTLLPALIIPLVLMLASQTEQVHRGQIHRGDSEAVRAPGPGATSQIPWGKKPARNHGGLPFISDPELIGTWKTVDFVREIADFNPSAPCVTKEPFLKRLVVCSDGSIKGTSFLWTKGSIYDGPNDRHPAHYEVRVLNGRPYLFFEWISGDVLRHEVKPSYYVLRKESSGQAE
jgi:uncharacterized membrane protein